MYSWAVISSSILLFLGPLLSISSSSQVPSTIHQNIFAFFTIGNYKKKKEASSVVEHPSYSVVKEGNFINWSPLRPCQESDNLGFEHI